MSRTILSIIEKFAPPENRIHRDWWWAFFCVLGFWVGFISGNEMDFGWAIFLHGFLALILFVEWIGTLE